MKFDNDRHGFGDAADRGLGVFRHVAEAASGSVWMTEMEELGGREAVPRDAGALKKLYQRFADRLLLRQQWWNNRARSVLQELRAGLHEDWRDGDEPLLLWIVHTTSAMRRSAARSACDISAARWPNGSASGFFRWWTRRRKAAGFRSRAISTC